MEEFNPTVLYAIEKKLNKKYPVKIYKRRGADFKVW